ncbi:histidine phosphatase family protein [Sporomusa acidovorans]|uniref:Histidine phosphatase superfamily n=2 Tax=Sporomusa TaxID=2375 RepID=A0ABZ3JAK3_SPOA4|nr:histidine phosphatase family protein [Sporomusa acidovorans]OZC13201.1 histidine phosphatase superfamily (branch 1) [Sporomusa acidovorans DSM 3132]SDE01329.1 Histidine phosphatase superfamily (branch 1) [Sporomusa acidovorans]
MKIGLVRHFEVNCPHEFLMNAAKFREWVNQYDCSPTKPIALPAGTDNWDKCYCSDLPRAVETAQHIYQGEIIKTGLLREVPIAPVIETNLKLPYPFWLAAGRLAWYCSHQSQPETMRQTKWRIQRFIAGILEAGNSDILIVTHGFLMIYIQQELLNKGFTGGRIRKARHGKIQVFTKKLTKTT